MRSSHQDVTLIETNQAHGTVAQRIFACRRIALNASPQRERIHEGMVRDAIGRVAQERLRTSPRKNRDESTGSVNVKTPALTKQ